MTDSLAHRGPDNADVKWFDESASGLGHRRLSILDPSPAGHQPMCNERGNLWITHNGEVYNFQEIRDDLVKLGHRFVSNSDTEVILKAYEAWGEKCLLRFNGMFAFAIYDSERKELFAARDRIGVKPFYYHYDNGRLVFASEIKAILCSTIVTPEPDYNALYTPARFQISPMTGFRGIYKLPPGHYLRLSGGQLTVIRYWKIEASESYPGTLAEARYRLDQMLQDAVRLQMIADVPVGVFLSGGLDSSIVSALMRRNSHNDIHAFTIRFSDTDQRFEKMPDDSTFARKVAMRFRLQYHEVELQPDICSLLPKLVWHLDEPLADPAALNTFLISKAARELGIVVLLNGMGGDEIFGGYRKLLACLKADTYQRFVPGIVRSFLAKTFERIPVATGSNGFRLLRWSKRFLSFASLPQVERYLASDLSLSEDEYNECFVNGIGYKQTHFYTSQKHTLTRSDLSYLTKMCLNDTLVFLPEHNLNYLDKAAMAMGVECRPPLTDHRIVEYLFSLPPQFRIRRGIQKYLLKKVAEEYLPSSIVHRAKAPFGAPLRSWIRGALAPMVADILSFGSVRARGLYNPEYVTRLIQRDRDGMEDNAHTIWMLLTTELWFRTFFDGKS
jgi:asparagine synthase (glutamine-hydrolysing)